MYSLLLVMATVSELDASGVSCWPEEVTGDSALEVAELGQPSQRLTVTDAPVPEDSEPEGLSTGWPMLVGVALGQPGQAVTVTDTCVPEGPELGTNSVGEV